MNWESLSKPTGMSWNIMECRNMPQFWTVNASWSTPTDHARRNDPTSIPTIWVNYNDLIVFPHWEWWLVGVTIPFYDCKFQVSELWSFTQYYIWVTSIPTTFGSIRVNPKKPADFNPHWSKFPTRSSWPHLAHDPSFWIRQLKRNS